MTWLVGLLAAMAIMLGVSLAYVGWRDRHRLPWSDDSTAVRSAAASAARYAAEPPAKRDTGLDGG